MSVIRPTITGVSLAVAAMFALEYLGIDSLPFPLGHALALAVGLVCLSVGAHVERT